MNPTAKMIDGKLYFNDFVVQKESGNFYGVYESFMGYPCTTLITSGTSMESAAKKAKLLQIGWDLRDDLQE